MPVRCPAELFAPDRNPVPLNCYILCGTDSLAGKMMGFEFVPLESSEQAVLIDFLVTSFRAEPVLQSFNPEVIRWKYFSPHPDWVGPRSYAVKRAGEIVAHGGIWPVRFRAGDREINAIHLIDWAASRSAVGAGVYLLRKIAGIADALLTVGGSPETRNLLPKLGYKSCGELRHYARAVRPWLHFRTRPQKDWKAPLKLLRDSGRAFVGLPQASKEWTAEKISAFTRVPDIAQAGTASCATPLRSLQCLDRLLQCPAAEFSGYLVRETQRARGYFLLSQVGNQVRIVDARLDSDDPEAWQSLCRLAAATAAQSSEAAEIVTGASRPIIQQAWVNAGLVHRQTDPILCYDPRTLLPAKPLDLSLADGDHCFLSDPQAPYLL